MRLSVHRDDPGYHPAAFGAVVVVNGRTADCCHTADEEMGLAWCHARDAEGKFFLHPRTGEIAGVIMFGDVKIKVRRS